MSTSLSSRPSAPGHPTRQQLDELDALLQRMLDLPVNQVEDEPVPETRSRRPTPAAAPTPAVMPPAPVREAPDYRTEEPPAEAPWQAAPPQDDPREQGPAAPPQEYVDSFAPPMSYMVVETAGPEAMVQQAPVPTSVPGVSRLEPRLIQPAVEEYDPPAGPEATPFLPAPAAPPEEEVWVPLHSSWQPSPQTWGPLAETWQQRQAVRHSEPVAEPFPPPAPEPAPDPVQDQEPAEQFAPPAPAPVVEPEEEPEPAAVVSPLPEPAVAEEEPVTVAPTPWTLWPLVAFNRTFDLCLTPLGAPGRWLCGPTGRTLLGLLGLLCLAAAVLVVVADEIGWTW